MSNIQYHLLVQLSCFFLLISCGASSDSPDVDTEIPLPLPPANMLSDKSDDFSGDGALLSFVTNNENSLPDVVRSAGRYRANLIDNTNDITLHFNDRQGRLDAKLLAFPFEFVARNIGIGTQLDSQASKSSSGNSFIFAGVQIHVEELNSLNSSHIVVGHRGQTSFTLEGKNTVNGVSSVNDLGANIVPTGRADIRVVGNVDESISIYWQQPGLSVDAWQPYNGNARLPGNPPTYGSQVYVGLITYAQGSGDIPFVGTCDAIEIYE